MSDHRIGLNLDVRNTTALDRLQNEFSNIGDAADQIRSRFERLDQYSNQMMKNGFGSATYTRELRDQLNLVQQMARVLENEARRTGNSDALQSLQSSRASLGNLNGELSAYGGIQGNSMGNHLMNMGKMAGFAALGTLGAVPLSMFRNGFGAAYGMLPQSANFSKTMVNNPTQATNSWFYNMLGSAGGYGYTDGDILSGANTLKGAMGRSGNFNNYMRGIAQFGRYNGFDFNQAASYFSQNYQAGGNLSPLQYATLVAQTVNTANMQGRNGQVADAITQLTQMSSQMSLNANTQQIAQLYATGASSGNQAWKNNLASTMASVNAGISSPGGGPMGQAMMIQALMPGLSSQDRNYFGQQMLQSGGAFVSPFSVFGRGSKTTNFQSFMEYTYKHYGGNTEAADVALSQLLPGINPITARQLMGTYMKGGHFNEASFSKNLPNLKSSIMHSNSTPLDKTVNNFNTAVNNFQKAASSLLGPKSQLVKILGAHPDASTVAGAAAAGIAGHGLLGSLLGGAGGAAGGGIVGHAVRRMASRSTARRGTSFLGRMSKWAKGLFGGGAGAEAGTAVEAGAEVGGLEAAGAGLDATGIGALIGIPLGLAGIGLGAWSLMKGHGSHSKGVSSKPIQNGDLQSEVTNVVAVLMALRPWAGQISQWYGGSNGGSSSGSARSFFSLPNATNSNSAATIIQNIPNATPIQPSDGSGMMNLSYAFPTSSSSYSQSDNAKQIYSYLAKKGLSSGAIFGILGNLMQESSLNPTITNKSSGAYGIAQWLGSRKTGLAQYATQTGGSVKSLNTQLGYLWKELQSGADGSISTLNHMSPSQAAVYFEQKYERAGAGADLSTRAYYANQFAHNMKVSVSAPKAITIHLVDYKGNRTSSLLPLTAKATYQA